MLYDDANVLELSGDDVVPCHSTAPSNTAQSCCVSGDIVLTTLSVISRIPRVVPAASMLTAVHRSQFRVKAAQCSVVSGPVAQLASP